MPVPQRLQLVRKEKQTLSQSGLGQSQSFTRLLLLPSAPPAAAATAAMTPSLPFGVSVEPRGAGAGAGATTTAGWRERVILAVPPHCCGCVAECFGRIDVLGPGDDCVEGDTRKVKKRWEHGTDGAICSGLRYRG